MTKKALVTTCTASFCDGALALLRSAKRYHPHLELFIFTDSVSLTTVAGRFSGLAHVLPIPRRLVLGPNANHTSISKVFAVSVPADIVAFVDSDAVFCAPAEELWSVEGAHVRAVADRSSRVLSTVPENMKSLYRRQFGSLSDEGGINGGVWALATAAWHDLPERYEQLFAEGQYPDHPLIFEQPLLNALFLPKVQWLPFSFNAHNLFENAVPPDARIVHFTGRIKPWMNGFPKHEPHYIYWLRFGAAASWTTLLLARLRILLLTPKRLTGRWLRKRFPSLLPPN